MSTELKHLLYHQICREFEQLTEAVEENISRYAEALLKVSERGSRSVMMAFQGTDTADPEFKDLDLLEKAGALKSEIKFTERNIYKIFSLSDRGKTLVNKLETEKRVT
jgi:microsomal dipeptidase-like Zn-dependent dipeptidase